MDFIIDFVSMCYGRMPTRAKDYMLTILQIMEIIPHRPPFLLVDRVLELEPGVRALGEKLVTITEPFFQGHFPGRPIMPGVLIVEALAQTGAIAILSLPENRGKMPLFGGMEKVRFRRTVQPGDVLKLDITLDKVRRGVGKARGKATVDDEIACAGEMTFALTDNPS